MLLLHALNLCHVKIQSTYLVSNKPIIIKGCADEKFNKFIYSQLIQKIQGVVSSIMYGEACSSVPIFKRK